MTAMAALSEERIKQALAKVDGGNTQMANEEINDVLRKLLI